MDVREELTRRAGELGFALVGVASAERSEHMGLYREWLASDHHGDMGYLAREDAVARRADLGLTMEDAASVVVVAHEYFQADPSGAADDPSVAIIARYARGRDYHRVVKRKLHGLLDWLDEAVEGGVRGRAYVDTGPILERELGRRAGLGWFGRNTMLIHPTRGSYFFVGALLVDIDLGADEPFVEDRCGTCRACLDACPTGALLGRNEDGAPVMDARLCISYLTIEQRGPIPAELRPLMGNRVYGCDICQEVCPFNVRFARESEEPAYAARGWVAAGPAKEVEREEDAGDGGQPPRLVDVLEVALDESAWDAHTRGSPVRRAGRAGLARNACVGLGNWGAAEAVPVLAQALADPEPLVRGHAAWALGRVGGDAAAAALRARCETESDPFVLAELGDALGA